MSLNWSSVKNLLIAILIAANLFMVFNIVRQHRLRNYVDETELSDAIELLAERGLSVPLSSIPTKKFKAPIYESIYSEAYLNNVATFLTNTDVTLYMQPDNTLSGQTADGEQVMFDSEFGFSYIKNDKFDISAYADINADNFLAESKTGTEFTSSQLRSYSSKVTEYLNVGVSEDASLKAAFKSGFHSPEKGLSFLLAYQQIDGIDIYSHYAVCVFANGELVGIHGRWYFASLDEEYHSELQDQINILFADLEYFKGNAVEPFNVPFKSNTNYDSALPSENQPRASMFAADALTPSGYIPQVISMDNCYTIYWNSDKTALYFIPAWQITHIGGVAIVYNATNGTVYSRN